MNSCRTISPARHPVARGGTELRQAAFVVRGACGTRARSQTLAVPTILLDGSGPTATKPWLRIGGGCLLPPELRGAVVALGNFDGFHLGHQAVISRAVEIARSRGVAAIVATFDPHPVRHFAPQSAPFRLTTLDQRQRMFHAAGVDAMMVFDFNGALAEVTPENFVDRWLAGTGGVVIGDAFCFGRRRTGTAAVLADLAAQRGMTCDAVGAVAVGDVVVSSSRIRRSLATGDCKTAAALLSRPFAISGTLCDNGAAATLSLGGYLRLPAGSYAARLRLPDGSSLPCTAALAADADAVRVHLPNLPPIVFGQHVEIDMLRRLPCRAQVAPCTGSILNQSGRFVVRQGQSAGQDDGPAVLRSGNVRP